MFEPGHYKVTFQLPLRKNDDKPFSADVWRWWGREWRTVLNRIGAESTRWIVPGGWRGRGERNYLTFVIVEREEHVTLIRELVLRACLKFEQDYIYFEVQRTFFELLDGRS